MRGKPQHGMGHPGRVSSIRVEGRGSLKPPAGHHPPLVASGHRLQRSGRHCRLPTGSTERRRRTCGSVLPSLPFPARLPLGFATSPPHPGPSPRPPGLPGAGGYRPPLVPDCIQARGILINCGPEEAVVIFVILYLFIFVIFKRTYALNLWEMS